MRGIFYHKHHLYSKQQLKKDFRSQIISMSLNQILKNVKKDQNWKNLKAWYTLEAGGGQQAWICVELNAQMFNSYFTNLKMLWQRM